MYEINRILLQGLIQPPEEWTPVFAERFSAVLNFVDNSFNAPASRRLEALGQTFYPPALLNQLRYLNNRSIRHQGETQEEAIALPNPLLFLVPSCVTRENMSVVARQLPPETRDLFCQSLSPDMQSLFSRALLGFQLEEAVREGNEAAITALYQSLPHEGELPVDRQTIPVDRRSSLASALSTLHAARILTQENFNAVAAHADPHSLSLAFSRLYNNAGMLTPENRALVIAHAHPDSLASVLRTLHQAEMLTEGNRELVAGCRNMKKLQKLTSFEYKNLYGTFMLSSNEILALVGMLDNDVLKVRQAIKKAEQVKHIALPSSSQAFNDVHLYIFALRLYETVNQKLSFLSIHREGYLIAIASLRDAAVLQKGVKPETVIEIFKKDYPALKQYLPNSVSSTVHSEEAVNRNALRA